jgi:Fe-S-cluster-containing dehydrogenase component
MAPIRRGLSSIACKPSKWANSPTPKRFIFPSPACIARNRRACRCARPGRPTSVKEDGIVLVDYDKCIGCKYCSWACPYGARELDEQQKVMKKCTLCVDRIYDMTMSPG